MILLLLVGRRIWRLCVGLGCMNLLPLYLDVGMTG